MFTHGCSFAQDPKRKRQSDAKADGHGLKRPRASVRTLLWHIERHIDLDRRMGAHELETCSLPNVNFFLAHSLVKWNAHWSWIYGRKDQDLLIYYCCCAKHIDVCSWVQLCTGQIKFRICNSQSRAARTGQFYFLGVARFKVGPLDRPNLPIQRLAVFAGVLV